MTMTQAELDTEDWMDEWTAELTEDAYALVDDRQAPPFMATHDDTCDYCSLDIYEGEAVMTAGFAYIHAGCLENEGNVW